MRRAIWLKSPHEPQKPSTELPGTPDYVNSNAVKFCAEKYFGITHVGLAYFPEKGRAGFQGFDESQSGWFDAQQGWIFITPDNSLNSQQVHQMAETKRIAIIIAAGCFSWLSWPESAFIY